jgi:hypothetical protein
MTNPEFDPFSQENLNRIFVLSPKNPDRVLSRENSSLEFKESFGYRSLHKHMRSAAGFANARGGYIVYGIKDKPHVLTGLSGTEFSELDPERLCQFFLEYFDPEIKWDRHIHELGGKSFGLLYFYPSENKPVMCKKTAEDGKNLREGEIYFRYNGRTQTVKYSELKELIEERRKREQLLWFKHLKEIARIGIADAALFDLRKGTVKGAGGNLVIDESLIPQLAFIRDGEFNETKGKPTLKLIGTVEAAGSVAKNTGGRVQVIKTRGIRAADIIRSFLTSEKVQEPAAFLNQIAWESSAFLPCYYYIQLAGFTTAQAITCIEKEHSTNQAKAKLIDRLKCDDSLGMVMPSEKNIKGQRKLLAHKMLLSGKITSDISGKDLSDALDMIRVIKRNDLPIKYLNELLLGIFNRHFARQDQQINDKIRRAVCYVDHLHFSGGLAQ